MKKLKNKTFITIYSIFTSFIFIALFVYNMKTYNVEYKNIENNLMRMMRDRSLKPNNMENEIFRDELDNRIIMDYEVYTVLLTKDNNIFDIINHSNDDTDFNSDSVALNILNKENDSVIRINNLYFSDYSYNFKNSQYIIIINTKNASNKLKETLFLSIILFVILEIIIFFITKVLTNWIVKPALDSYDKQKDFIADASHELKTPLAVIMASADAMDIKSKDKKYLDNIKNESEKMDKLIKNLLELSKLENDKLIFNYEVNNLSKIIEKISLTFDAIAYEKNIKIETNIKSDVMFKCDSDQMSEMMGILIDNAIKHGYKDSIININLKEEKDKIVISVLNTGDEIKAEDKDKIFERFYRVDKSRNRESGRYGLGLAIAKNIVLNHNGKIEASSLNSKTTFKIVFKK